MTERVKLRVTPEEFADKARLDSLVKATSHLKINDWKLVRKSIDARQKQVWIDVEIIIATGDTQKVAPLFNPAIFTQLPDGAPQVIIVGAGPAGLFAALKALQLGWKPVIIERGKPVEDRLRDITALQKQGIINPDSNYCFGEGGAGAFSDGKLYTRSKKRGNIEEILALLHQHGASESVLYESHPHIGSDKLPGVIRAIRETILNNGGEIHFSTSFKDLIIDQGIVTGVVTDKGEILTGPVILATGHSARDIYEYLNSRNIRLESKGFAMGVRLEHPQTLIDQIIYHSPKGRGEYLPPAEYKMVAQIEGRGVYSFCMCPGGVIVPAVSDRGELVVNGMSASARSSRWANSGMVVEILPEDLKDYESEDNLGMLRFQKDIEREFYKESGSLSAPAQRMVDFIEGRISKDLPRSSYVPGLHPADFNKLLPAHIAERLKEGFKTFGRKNKGFLTNKAILVGLESRTSSPVRIPRDPVALHHPDLPGLYAAGEGAGFAGGIVSSAVDGVRAMEAIASNNDKL